MAKKKATAPKKKGAATKKKAASPKAKSKKNSLMPPDQTGSPFNHQDPKRRLGNYGGAGEHPLQGGRSSGIVGQTKQKNKTDRSGNNKAGRTGKK